MGTDTRTTEIAALLARLGQLMSEEPRDEVSKQSARPLPERVLLTAEEAAEQLGIGRTLMYKLIANDEIESIRIGRLRRVPAIAIQDYARKLLNKTRTDRAA
ncbi:MAG: DNA-binding protein [Pseudonocardiales bacterium]|nr:MAG: DNA-binding protein [Pseudonocardiales bacterium]